MNWIERTDVNAGLDLTEWFGKKTQVGCCLNVPTDNQKKWMVLINWDLQTGKKG